jgi:hypothetical protein
VYRYPQCEEGGVWRVSQRKVFKVLKYQSADDLNDLYTKVEWIQWNTFDDESVLLVQYLELFHSMVLSSRFW